MSAYATKFPPYPVSIRSVNEATRFASSRRTFEIHPAELYSTAGKVKDIYVVALRGTNQSLDKKDVLSLHVVLKAFQAKTNIYFEEVKNSMLSDIPKGSSVVMMGHSLGGMVAQQICADEDIKASFDILNVLTAGSPYVPVKGRSCPLHRFADCADVIPWLGHSLKANLKTEKPVFKCNGNFGRPVKAHTDSYRESPKFRDYDPFGDLNGGRIIVISDIEADK